MGKRITLRNVSDEVASRLARLSRERGQSVNATTLGILEQALDVDARRASLERYVTWTEEDRAEFDEALAAQRVVDATLWK
jgi:plasmid stability protein